jgi:hypothetical protein
MTRAVGEIAAEAALPVGVNVLRNDALAALAVAQAAGATMIRVNVLAGARVTDQGVLRGEAACLMRERARLGAEGIRVLADVDVKHSAPFAPRPIEDEARELVERAFADAVVLSGRATGVPPDAETLRTVKSAAAGRPVLVGSGVTPENAAELGEHAGGFIVGSWFKRGGTIDAEVDAARVAHLVDRLRAR